jgi:hypothetical protein
MDKIILVIMSNPIQGFDMEQIPEMNLITIFFSWNRGVVWFKDNP